MMERWKFGRATRYERRGIGFRGWGVKTRELKIGSIS